MNATHEKKGCFFRNKNNLNFDNMNSSLVSSAMSNVKGDTNYEEVNRSLSSLNEFMNNNKSIESNNSNDKPFYVNSIDTSMLNNNDTNGNVDFSKIKRNNNNKITNLDILINNGFNGYIENNKISSSPSRKQGRTLFLKSIKVKYISTPKEKSIPKEIPIYHKKLNELKQEILSLKDIIV